MHFSMEVTLGNLLQGGAIIVTLFVLHSQNVRRFANIELKVGLMWKSFEVRVHGMRGNWRREDLDDRDIHDDVPR